MKSNLLSEHETFPALRSQLQELTAQQIVVVAFAVEIPNRHGLEFFYEFFEYCTQRHFLYK